MKPCVRATDPYSGTVTELCHRTHDLPDTGSPDGIGFLVAAGLSLVLVGCCVWWYFAARTR